MDIALQPLTGMFGFLEDVRRGAGNWNEDIDAFSEGRDLALLVGLGS